MMSMAEVTLKGSQRVGGEGGTNMVVVVVVVAGWCFTQVLKTEFLPTSMNSLECA